MTPPDDRGPDSAHLFLDAAPDAIVAVRRDGMILMANQMAATLFGYTSDELVGADIEMLVPEAHRGAHLAHRTRYTAKPRLRSMGEPGSRLYARRADGTEVPVEIALSPLELDGADVVLAAVRDVSERLAAEAQFEGVRRSLDAVEDAVFMFDPADLEFIYANAGAAAQTEYNRQELVAGMTPLHIQPDLDRRALGTLLQPLLDGSRTSLTYETVQRTRSGHDLPVEVSLSWPETDNALARPIVAIVRDITQRRQAEDRLRASESAFRSAFDDANIPMAIVDLGDPEVQLVDRANPALAGLLGLEPPDLVGASLVALTHPDDRSRAVEQACSLSNGSSTHIQVEKRFRRTDGTYLWARVDASLLHRAEQADPLVLVHITDISRQVEAERQRDQRENLLQALATARKATLDEVAPDDVLTLIVGSLGRALDVTGAVVATSGPADTIQIRAVDDWTDPEWRGHVLERNPLVKRVLTTAEPEVLNDPSQAADQLADLWPGRPGGVTGPSAIVPLQTGTAVEGVLALTRPLGAPPFTAQEVAGAQSLAAEAAVTLVLARSRDERRRMLLIEDRERIARDLHDVVIQRLFATGMRLQAALGRPELLAERARESVTDLDETIADIRASIFQLTQPDETVTDELQRLIDRHRAVGRNDVELTVSGDLESVSGPMLDHLLPTINELLSNVERHAHADRAVVAIDIGDHEVAVSVTDDGIGLQVEQPQGFGLRNLARRAVGLGGSLSYGLGPTGSGTEVIWSVPRNDDDCQRQADAV